MEVIRIYNPDDELEGTIRVRKNIIPESVVSCEEHFRFPNFCTVIANNEVFIIDERYDTFVERVKQAKLFEPDGRI